MFRKLTSRHLLVVLAVGALFGFAGASYAGHGPLPHNDPPCTTNPNPTAVGQPFTLSATGLPTTDMVWLIVDAPGGSSTVSQVYVNPDGSWSGTEVANEAGIWTYTFSGPLANKKYGAVATCNELVTA